MIPVIVGVESLLEGIDWHFAREGLDASEGMRAKRTCHQYRKPGGVSTV